MAGTAARPDAWGALLLDMDGTLIDSMPLHGLAWKAWHQRHGLPFDDAGFFGATAGRTNDEILRDLFPTAGDPERALLADEKEALYRDLARESLQCVGGAEAFCVAARDAGLKLALCTASPRDNIAVAVQRFGLDRWVDTIACPADGLRGKPHPDLFLAAAERLGMPPARCLVFEDAPLGVEAARRAGMAAVALTTSMPATAFAGWPNCVGTFDDFHTIDLGALQPPTRLPA